MAGKMTVTLDADEALVLFELLARWRDKYPVWELVHPAEENALSAVLCLLEKQLEEPFRPDYLELVSSAQERLAPSGG
jgi:hypothetical protein